VHGWIAADLELVGNGPERLALSNGGSGTELMTRSAKHQVALRSTSEPGNTLVTEIAMRRSPGNRKEIPLEAWFRGRL
jgi:hypothetical protein